MKVINGHDYWDSAAAYGVDESICIVRNSKKTDYDFTTNNFYFPIIYYDDVETNKKRILPLGVLFVSGKSYPFAFHTISDPCNNVCGIYDLIPNKIIYSIEELKKLHPDMDKKSYWGNSDIEDYIQFCNQSAFSEKNVTNFLIDNNSAIALILPDKLSYGGWAWRKHGIEPKCETSMVWKNPSFLKDYQFYKIKDSFTMFMEVSNWISGVLPNSADTVEISDKSKIIKAGFDIKHSFRKEKEK